MRIDYDNSKVISKTVHFYGETDSGLAFTIEANWNDWDDWNVTPDEISWEGDKGTDEETEQIVSQFLKEMNG